MGGVNQRGPVRKSANGTLQVQLRVRTRHQSLMCTLASAELRSLLPTAPRGEQCAPGPCSQGPHGQLACSPALEGGSSGRCRVLRAPQPRVTNPHAPQELFLRSSGLFTSNICDSVTVSPKHNQSLIGAEGRGISHAGAGPSQQPPASRANYPAPAPGARSPGGSTTYFPIRSAGDRRWGAPRPRVPRPSSAWDKGSFLQTFQLPLSPSLPQRPISDFCLLGEWLHPVLSR